MLGVLGARSIGCPPSWAIDSVEKKINSGKKVGIYSLPTVNSLKHTLIQFYTLVLVLHTFERGWGVAMVKKSTNRMDLITIYIIRVSTLWGVWLEIPN